MRWKPVPGFEGLYEVSDTGIIVSLPRDYGFGKIHTKTPLKQEVSRGYGRVVLYRDGKRHRLLVHRIVAVAFIPNPNNLPCVNHKDEDRLNNRADNLMWCTPKENTMWGNCRSKISKAVSKPVNQYTKKGCLVKRWESMTLAANSLGISLSEISKCTRAQNCTAGEFYWRYADE